MSQLWYVYVDWTLEIDPRRFYVGKGNRGRVYATQSGARNALHGHFVRKYGLHRTIMFETLDEHEAYAVERHLIKLYKTFAHGGEGWFGANLDMGGMGGESTPKSLEHRQKIREFMKTRVGSKNSFYGKRHDPGTIQKIRESMLGELGPCFGRTGSAHPMFGTHHSKAALNKMSVSHLGKSLTPSHVAAIKLGHQKRNEQRRQRDAQLIELVNSGLSVKSAAAQLGVGVNIVYGAFNRLRSLQKSQSSEQVLVVANEG
jgi:hypothetical protein